MRIGVLGTGAVGNAMGTKLVKMLPIRLRTYAATKNGHSALKRVRK